MENDILQALYDRYYSAALLYTTALCADAELAKDLVADAFVKAYISLPQEIPSFPFWLFRVCKNLWIDHLRKQPALLSDDQLLSLADHQTPETIYLKNEDLATRGKRPSNTDMQYMKKAEDLLHSELSIALGIPFHEVSAFITSQIEQMK